MKIFRFLHPRHARTTYKHIRQVHIHQELTEGFSNPSVSSSSHSQTSAPPHYNPSLPPLPPTISEFPCGDTSPKLPPTICQRLERHNKGTDADRRRQNARLQERRSSWDLIPVGVLSGPQCTADADLLSASPPLKLLLIRQRSRFPILRLLSPATVHPPGPRRNSFVSPFHKYTPHSPPPTSSLS